MYSSIDEGAAEASRKNLRRSKSAVSDSPYKRVNLPRRSSGSMREVNIFDIVLNTAIPSSKSHKTSQCFTINFPSGN